MAKVRKIREDGEQQQGDMFPQSNIRTEKMFEVEMSLTLKVEGGKGDKITLISTKIRGGIVEEALHLALDDRRSRAIINAILDNPSQQEIEEAERMRVQIDTDAAAAL